MAAVGSGRAAGWDRLTAEQMNLIKDKFIPFAPRWGSTGYASQDAWLRAARATKENRIAGTFWAIVTASGAPVVSPKKSLEGALAAFQQLPQKDRQPAVEERGPQNLKLDFLADQEPPPGAMFVQVYCRVLERNTEGQLQAAHTVDLTEFGGRPGGNSLPNRINEPQREYLWLTEAEAQSLAPGDRRQGASYAVPAAIRQRIFLFYLYNWFADSGGGYWDPQVLRTSKLTLTVAKKSATSVRLRLEGMALFKRQVKPGPEPRESGQKGIPDPYAESYDARLLGVLEYDVARKQFSRFDAVALGDYRGHWGLAVKATPIPVGFAFQLDPRNLPNGRHAPYALSALNAHYWAPDQWKGRK
jgi:hypothetical protein